MRGTYIIAIAVVLGMASTDAMAESRYVLEPGDTLEAVARRFGCTSAEIMRANRVDTTLLPAGTRVRVPTCRRQVRTIATLPSSRLTSNAALAAIDGVTTPAGTNDIMLPAPRVDAADEVATSIGAPWSGKLQAGAMLPAGEGYSVRRPKRTFGSPHAIAYVQQAIAAVRSEFPNLHDLAIGDMSKAGGGKIDDHRSHQTGLDIDVGFYFTVVPKDYPANFAAGDSDLDLEATWALVAAFANTSEQPDGVRMMFLSHTIAGKLYHYALDHGVDSATLDAMFEFPHGKGSGVGLIRHQPHHGDHVHVRFRCARTDASCVEQ
jgi:hypothetical protein